MYQKLCKKDNIDWTNYQRRQGIHTPTGGLHSGMFDIWGNISLGIAPTERPQSVPKNKSKTKRATAEINQAAGSKMEAQIWKFVILWLLFFSVFSHHFWEIFLMDFQMVMRSVLTSFLLLVWNCFLYEYRATREHHFRIYGTSLAYIFTYFW